MKKIGLFFTVFVVSFVFLFLLVSCGNNAKIISYYLNSDGELIAVYDNDSEENLGKWETDIINSFSSISISEDGHYIIDGTKTKVTINDSIVNGVSNIEVSEDGYFIVNGVKTKVTINDSIVNGVSNIEISEDGYYIVNGIKTKIYAIDMYSVSFETGFQKEISPIKVKDGHKIEKPNLTREGYTLKGWFANDEEWHFNSDVITSDITLKATWTANSYTVKFENDKGANPLDMVVTYDSNVTLPDVEDVDGYTFDGWFNGNTKVNDGKWRIADDVVLVAKWHANTYTVTLDANGGSVSQTSVSVVYNENFKLPVPTNSYGVFTGWIYNDQPITDSEGNSLQKWSFTENVTLTVDWTIKVYTVDDLKKMGTYLNGEFILMNDINLEDVEWNPVGTNSNPFTGSLDGNGYSIKNLSIDTSYYNTGSSFGLFAYIRAASIKNLNVVNFTFTSENISKAYSVGAVAGMDLTTEKDLSDRNIITEKDSLITGITVAGTYSIAKQSADFPIYSGGVFGKVECQIIYNCVSSIDISSDATYSGGIVGYVKVISLLYSCSNRGSIIAGSYGGGMVGFSDYGVEIFRCFNEGDISSPEATGGLIGAAAYMCLIEESYNKGSITSTIDRMYYGAGGLIGTCYPPSANQLPEITISNSYNSGDVTSVCAGGLIGGTYKVTISNSYNSGTIKGSKYSGGIGGFIVNGTVKQCLASGTVSGAGSKFTICTSSAIICSDCYYTYSSTSGFNRNDGTYTSNKYGSTLYKNDMFWSEYNESTNKGYWIFSDSDYPKLYWE